MTPWEVWCDVGGTFTDCFLVSSNGERKRIKVLSSGLIKGHLQAVTSEKSFVDASRRKEPQGFWIDL
jgi:5-oxoprolinase (ATP-hydrolysing)